MLGVSMTAGQIRAARALIGMTQAELAEASGVSLPTIKRIETGADAKVSTVEALRSALATAGVEFLPENGGGVGVRLKKGSS
ncbi:MAG TPA: transcriptional regulator [Gemmobacter sp.]|nr:transcriptional regulator [Gemmobacter sp.]HBU13670.1 transcriptional regulator [Gemmobacter sp.]